jgi:hypothetical protein
MEVLHALQLRTINHAILKIVELIVMWVSGKTGAVALSHAVAACNTELAKSSLLLMEMVTHVLRPRAPFLATHNLVDINA